MKSINYTKRALRSLRKMPRNQAQKIVSKIDLYAQDPQNLQHQIKNLKGREALRLRVDNWRIIMDDQGNVLDILDILPRGSAYKK